MKKPLLIFLLCVAFFSADRMLWAQPAETSHVQARFLSDSLGVQPGRPFWVGLQLNMAEGWHTYWENPGDSGLATVIKWELPDGFSASAIRWPYPQAFDEEGLTTYGYTGEVVLLTQITPPADISAKTIDIKARAKWLECKEICVPGKADLSLTLPVVEGIPETDEASAKIFSDTGKSLPVEAGPQAPWQVSANVKGDFLVFKIISAAKTFQDPGRIVFFPKRDDVIEHGAVQELEKSEQGYTLKAAKSALFQNRIRALEGVLVCDVNWGGSGNVRALAVNVPLKFLE